MAQVIGPELRFKAIFGKAFRAGHDAGIGNDEIERLAFRHEPVRRATHAGKRGKVHLHQLYIRNLAGGGMALIQIAHGADDRRAMGGKSAGGFNAKTGGNAGDQNALACEIDAGQHLIRRGRRAELLSHGGLLCSGLFETRLLHPPRFARYRQRLCPAGRYRLNGGCLRFIYGGSLRLARETRS
jgi:hypothetical protein